MFQGHVWIWILWERLQSKEIQTKEPFSFEGDKEKYFEDQPDCCFQEEFKAIMTQLPVPVYEREVEEMFQVVDTDRDGRISYQEFCVSFIEHAE